MDMEDVGNNAASTGLVSTATAVAVPELADLDREFAEAAEDFGLGDQVLGDGGELEVLDAEIEGSEFASAGEVSLGGVSLLDIADGVMPESFGESQAEGWRDVLNPFRKVIRNKARRLIKKLVALVKKYKKYKSCVPAVVKAIKAYKSGKWGTALKASYAAYRCIKSK